MGVSAGRKLFAKLVRFRFCAARKIIPNFATPDGGLTRPTASITCQSMKRRVVTSHNPGWGLALSNSDGYSLQLCMLHANMHVNERETRDEHEPQAQASESRREMMFGSSRLVSAGGRIDRHHVGVDIKRATFEHHSPIHWCSLGSGVDRGGDVTSA